MADRRVVKRRSTDPVPVDRRSGLERRHTAFGPLTLDGPILQRTRTKGRRAADVLLIVTAAKRGAGGGTVVPPSASYSAYDARSTVTYVPHPVQLTGSEPAGFTAPALPTTFLTTAMDRTFLAPATGKTVHLCDTAAQLTTALSAVAADTSATPHVIVLTSGNTFDGNFTLPAKQGAQVGVWTYLLSSAVYNDTFTVAEGNQCSPSTTGYAIVQTSNSGAAFHTATSAAAGYYRLAGLEIRVNTTVTTNYGIVLFGDGSSAQSSTSLMPSYLVADRCYIHAHHTNYTTQGLLFSRGVALNCGPAAVVDCYIDDIRNSSSDAQAIGGWNGTGPYKIVGNYLSGSGETILLGGSAPSIGGSGPTDLEIRRNRITKDPSWITETGSFYPREKNLLEFKHGQRILVEGNVLRYSWSNAQVGFAMLLSVIDDTGNAATVQDVVARYNQFDLVANGFQYAGVNSYVGGVPAPDTRQPPKRVLFQHNFLNNIADTSLICPVTSTFGGDPNPGGNLILEQSGTSSLPSDSIAFDHNTFLYSTTPKNKGYMSTFGGPLPVGYITAFSVTNNLFDDATYGFIADSLGAGTASFNAHCSSPYTVVNNAFTGESSGSYPATNYFPATRTALALNASYVPTAASLATGATDGTAVGADMTTVTLATSGV